MKKRQVLMERLEAFLRSISTAFMHKCAIFDAVTPAQNTVPRVLNF